MLDLIINVNSPTQNGLLDSFDSPGSGVANELVRGDKVLAISHRPVVPSITIPGSADYRPWDDDHLSTDTYQIAIGNRDEVPTGGTWPLGIKAGAISTVSIASPTTITTAAAHNLVTGDTIYIPDNTGSTPSINGAHTVTVTGVDTFTIPVNVTTGGTGGSVYDTEGADALDEAVTAAALETLFSALSVKHGYPALDVTLLETGAYEFAWASVGAVPALYSGTNQLTPDSTVTVLVDEAGDSATQAVQLVLLRQSPVAYAEPSTEFPAAAIAAAIEQAGDATHNKIYSITMTAGTYGGSFTLIVTAATGAAENLGSVAHDISEDDFATLLATQTVIASTANVSVSRVGDVLTVEFRGTQALSNVPVIAVTNLDLVAPLGVSGTIALNTVSLYRAFLASSGADTLSFTLSIRRTRATGEESEYYLVPVTLKRNLIDVTTLVSATMPDYYTEAEVDVLLTTKVTADASITTLTLLRAIVTADDSAPAAIIVNISGVGRVWELIAGTNADDGLVYVRPDDYDGSTNAFVWHNLL